MDEAGTGAGAGVYEIPFVDRLLVVFLAVVAGMALLSTMGK